MKEMLEGGKLLVLLVSAVAVLLEIQAILTFLTRMLFLDFISYDILRVKLENHQKLEFCEKETVF
jgi:hypothetical protein